ncbi:MAG: FAD-dependent oxidoreductase, partial [Planctomycetaceae bacterium]
MIDVVHESARNTPVIGEYDVVVVGGGVAGVAAAVAASRNGASTLLIENHCVLGGLATEGLIAIYLPICDGRGNQVMGGLAEEMLRLTVQNAPAKIPACWTGTGDIQQRTAERFLSRFAPQPYMLALEDFVRQAGAKLAYDTRLCGVDCGEGKIKAVIVENKTGRCAIRARAFIDASGDADICVRAGEPTKTHSDNTRSSWFVAYDGQKLDTIKCGDNYVDIKPGAKRYAGDNHEDVTEMLLASRQMVMERIARMRMEQSNDAIYPA